MYLNSDWNGWNSQPASFPNENNVKRLNKLCRFKNSSNRWIKLKNNLTRIQSGVRRIGKKAPPAGPFLLQRERTEPSFFKQMYIYLLLPADIRFWQLAGQLSLVAPHPDLISATGTAPVTVLAALLPPTFHSTLDTQISLEVTLSKIYNSTFSFNLIS